MKVLIGLVIIAGLVVFGYQAIFPEDYEKAKEVAVVATQQTAEKVQKGMEKVQESGSQMVTNASKEVTDAVSQMGQEITDAVNNKINQELDRTKQAIYTALEPMFPWAFIIFFLLLFGALKAVIPFSQMAIVQLTLALMAYIFSIKVFYDMKLVMYALEGTFWLSLPFAIVFTGYYFFKDKVTDFSAADFIGRLNKKLKSIIGGTELQAATSKEPITAATITGTAKAPQSTEKPNPSPEQLAAKRIAEKRAALNQKLKAENAPRHNNPKAAQNHPTVPPKNVKADDKERDTKKEE